MEAQLYPKPNDKEEEEENGRNNTHKSWPSSFPLVHSYFPRPPLFLFFVTSTTSSKESYDLFCWSKWLRSRSKTEMTERKNEYWKREARRYWTIFCSYDKMVGRFCLIGLELFDWKGFIHGNWKRNKDWQYCHVLYGRLFFFWSSRTCRSRKDIPYSLIPT